MHRRKESAVEGLMADDPSACVRAAARVRPPHRSPVLLCVCVCVRARWLVCAMAGVCACACARVQYASYLAAALADGGDDKPKRALATVVLKHTAPRLP